MLISKMADARENFPTEESLQELISSMPREWQGLFAALNVKESMGVHSGTKWLRDNSSSLRKNFISPHWPHLVRSLCQMFPVVLNRRVIFQPKFACFTLKLQRNIMCFIVYHSESIPTDDIKVFVSMLVKLPQVKQSWCMALVSTLQTQLSNRESLAENTDIKKMKSSGFDLISNSRAIKISDCCISESNKKRLRTLCSRINASSSPSCSLLSSKLELMANQWEDQTGPTEGKDPNIDQDEYNPVTYMEVDNFVQSEVVEISDDSQEAAPCSLKEVTNSPTISKMIAITLRSPKISPTTEVSNFPRYSALHETLKEINVNQLVASPTTHLSEVPNPPELEIMDMEVEPAAKDPIVDKYAYLKSHLRSSEDLDAEHIQEFISCFSENSPKTLGIICKFLEMNTVPETSAVMLIRQFLSLENECSFQATILFAEYCIGSWLGTLQQAGSRNLLATVGAFAQKHPKAFIEGVILKQFHATRLLWPQCDLMVKVVKNLEKETLQYFMEKLLQSKEDSSSVWNDYMIQLLSAILERKLDLDASIFEKFVNCLQVQSLPLASSLKFAKLVLMIINKYGLLVKPCLSTFKQMLEENNTFLKKSALTALKKLEE